MRLIDIDFDDVAFPFKAGQAVTVGLSGSPLRKPYSIASAPWELEATGTMQLLTQIDESGGPGPHLELALPGTRLDIEGPFGSFGLPAEVSTPLLFIAGGTGIAPLRSMLIQHLARSTTLPITLVYSARSAEEFAFRPELAALQSASRISAYFTVTRGEHQGWQGRRGRIDASLLREALPSPQSLCLICGPTPLVNDTRQLLGQLGVAERQILVEEY